MKLSFVALMVLLISSMAFARIDADDSFAITESNKTITFSVTNTDVHNALPLRLTLAGPFASTMSPFPDALSPGETKTFTATIATHPNLEGQTYRASIVAKVGSQTQVKPIQLTFQNVTEATDEEDNGATGFFGLGAINAAALSEGALNAILIVVLIVIVIAVIARVYKRVSTKPKNGGN